jgi:hypothetical protein
LPIWLKIKAVEKSEFMQELLKILLDALRKQAFSVILLVIACGVMGKIIVDMKQEAKEMQERLEGQIMACHLERQNLMVRVAVLEAVNKLPASQRLK